MIPYLFEKFQRSKWEGLWNLAEIEITLRYGNFSNYANMDRPCRLVWKVAISFSKCNFSHFERVKALMWRVTITWMRYHTRYHMRYHISFIRFAWFWAIYKALPSHFLKNNNIFFINLTVTRGNHVKLREYLW